MPGKKLLQYSAKPEVCFTKESNNNPTPATAGPDISNSRGPYLSARVPDNLETVIIRIVNGKKVKPACNWLYPCTCTILRVINKIPAPRPAYRKKVRRFAP